MGGLFGPPSREGFAYLAVGLIGSAVALAVVGSLQLWHWAKTYRLRGPKAPRRELKDALAVFTIATVLLLAGVSGARWAAEETARWQFSYFAELRPNGTGTVRVTLPMPTDETLLSTLRISSPSATIAVNRSGDEAALDVIVSEPTWLNASVTGTFPTRNSQDLNLTRSKSDMRCIERDDCHGEIAISVLSGGASSVFVRLWIGIEKRCSDSRWVLRAEALPGVASYPATRGWTVC